MKNISFIKEVAKELGYTKYSKEVLTFLASQGFSGKEITTILKEWDND